MRDRCTIEESIDRIERLREWMDEAYLNGGCTLTADEDGDASYDADLVTYQPWPM